MSRYTYAPDGTPLYHCIRCEDTGFVRGVACNGTGQCRIGRCGHPGYHNYAHTYTTACHCRADNPILQEQRQFLIDRTQKQQEGRSR
jgi:hypothetical protein